MVIRYKKKCIKCKKNYALVIPKERYVVCYECQKADMQGEIKDPKMKKMFKISEEFYKDNSFLRDIKVKYIRYGSLTEKQIAAFKKTVDKMKKLKKDEILQKI